MSELAAIKSRQQQAWATGDYTMIGMSTVLVSELLCEAVDIRASHRVLDVATGSGNTALAAARRSADVTGIDYWPGQLDTGGLFRRKFSSYGYLPLTPTWPPTAHTLGD